MSIVDDRRHQVFPVLTTGQREEAGRFASGPRRHVAPRDILFALGEAGAPAFLVLAGTVDVVQRDGLGVETPIIRHGAGEITGEISQLAGRPALAEGRAGPEGAEVLPFDPPHLRALVVGSAEIGEVVMRAFILRRTALITEGGAGSVLVGHVGEPRLVRLQGFLARNGQPHTVLDPTTEADAEAIVQRFGVAESDLPIALCPDGTLLRRPSEAELGARLGITPELADDILYDVAVVGAGPAGLATAVYAASEGLSTLVLDGRSFGGQAGASARIENYFGFPTGITGQALTARAFTQAQKFGAEIAIPLEVAGLECGRPDALHLNLTSGQTVRAKTVVVASGARYRRPDIPDLAEYEGAGISYWASPVEATLCEGAEVALVGAGNSAGQAVVYLAPKVARLHLVVRGEGLAASMSRYLIDRIEALPNIVLHTRTEVVGLAGEPGVALARVTFRHRETGEEREVEIRHLFLFIGADPNAEWLSGCAAARDAKGFVLTGEQGALPLETTVKRVFAIGDVRSGSTKRVAAAVGEGAAVVAQLHRVLAGD